MAVIVVKDPLRRTELSGEATRIVAVTLLPAVPTTFVVAWTISLIQPGHILAPMQLRAIFAAVAAVQLLIVVTGTVTIAREARTTTPSDDDVPSPAYSEAEAQAATFPRALLDRLPGVIRPDICVLETEDQDLRVHAGGGSALILMRMADAVGMIDPRLDAQVHRPWWVA